MKRRQRSLRDPLKASDVVDGRILAGLVPDVLDRGELLVVDSEVLDAAAVLIVPAVLDDAFAFHDRHVPASNAPA